MESLEVMYILFWIACIFRGIFMALRPEDVYDRQERFRSSTPGKPSDRYLHRIRVCGILMTVLGAAGVAVWIAL